MGTYCRHEDYPCCGCREEMLADAYYFEDESDAYAYEDVPMFGDLEDDE